MALRCASLLFISAAGALAAEGTVESCAAADRGTGRCGPAVGDEDTMGMLQSKTASRAAQGGQQQHHHKLPDVAQVWKQLKAAVLSDDLQEVIQQEGTGSGSLHLREELQRLQHAFPKSNQLKEQFASTWALVRTAANTELIQEKLKKARAKAPQGKEAGELEAQLAAIAALRLQDVRAQAAENWASLQEHGVVLPDLADVTDQAQQIADSALDAVRSFSGIVASATSAQAREAYTQAQHAFATAWERSHVQDAYHRVQDATASAWHEQHVQDAVGFAGDTASRAWNEQHVQRAAGVAQHAADHAVDVAQHTADQAFGAAHHAAGKAGHTVKSAWDSAAGSVHNLLR